jgi:hypothetical protein
LNSGLDDGQQFGRLLSKTDTPSAPKLICIGASSLGWGPLNVLCEPWPGDRIKTGAATTVADGTLRIGDDLRVHLAAAEMRRPPPAPVWTLPNLLTGLAALDRSLLSSLPRDGLACCLPRRSAGRCNRAHTRAAPAIDYLTSLVRCASQGAQCAIDAQRIAPLIGLGPGLTPAGDDYLGGTFIALSQLGMTDLCRSLWLALSPLLSSHTNDISHAHLAAASEGYGCAALHDILRDLLAGDPRDMRTHLSSIAAVGHTSGWDALAGAVNVLRAVATASAPPALS